MSKQHIEVFDNTKVFVVAPAGLVTGGPEILHSLVHTLRGHLGIDAYMYYFPHSQVIPDEYREYNLEIANTIEDDSRNILVVPEVFDILSFASKFKSIRKVVFWLSVDFFYQSLFIRTFRGFLMTVINRLNIISLEKFNKVFLPHFDIHNEAFKRYGSLDLKNFYLLKDVSLHIVQGVRILEHLRSKGIDNSVCVFDYINEKFLNVNFDIKEKENIVCYNPKKGLRFTKKIIDKGKGIVFVPIVGLSRDGVIDLLRRAKVYIDFGNFPGRERIPREAVMLGCCVITGRSGSAVYYQDVPIPEEYKFDDVEENIPKILDKVRECIEKYEEKVFDFEESRKIVKEEPKFFTENIRKVFVKNSSV